MNTLVYAIHGFLGKSSDWDSIKNSLNNINFVAEDLFSKELQLDYFLKRVESFNLHRGKKIFLGYSLGGRLGLQILKKNPELFDHYIFLSTNPGLQSSAIEERKKRVQSDQTWSQKINEENWDHLLQEWNSQPVFQGSKGEPKRELEHYNLQKLKESMTKWSLGEQEDFSDIIQMNNHKITWMVGEHDEKYCEIAENMKNKKILRNYKKVPAGHRIWLDNPGAVADVTKKIIAGF